MVGSMERPTLMLAGFLQLRKWIYCLLSEAHGCRQRSVCTIRQTRTVSFERCHKCFVTASGLADPTVVRFFIGRESVVVARVLAALVL